MKCSLCASEASLFSEVQGRMYYKCPTCQGIFLDPSHHLSSKNEKERYLLHKNNIYDPSYQKFVLPIVNRVKKEYTQEHIGLDFGSGSGPVITHLLRQQKHQVYLYDPFFHPDMNALTQKYHYIMCCEVMEHFYNPAKEFKLLQSLLLQNGTLYCKTKLFDVTFDFNSWWYKNDPTHVFFYTKETIQWIAKSYNFKNFEITKDLIVFKK